MNTLRRLTGNFVLSRLFQEKRTITSVRFLYNEQFLGIDRYLDGRQRTINRLGSMKDSFYNRMRTHLNSPAPSMIFTEDLKTVIHTCENNPEEIETCILMLKRFHKQNKELRFGTFVFGPVVMRLFYYLRKQDIMLEFYRDPELEGFFDQLKSYYLSMDMCFKTGMYDEIIKAFEQIQHKKLGETNFPREAVVLTTGACFKLNTPETYRLATDLVAQVREARVPILRKALGFVAALSLKQNRPDVALEILTSTDRFDNMTANNLKLTALAQLDRLEEAFVILRCITYQDSPVQSRVRGQICQATLDTVQQAVDKAGDKELSHIFEQLCRSLKENNSVTKLAIDDLVCLPIVPREFPRDADPMTFRGRERFPEQSFRSGERSSSEGDRADNEFPLRRRHFAGLPEEY